MNERPTGPASSFTSTPSDNGRAYQARGDQNFHEHHYHGSAPPPPSAPVRRKPALYALTGSLTAMAAVLVLLAGAGGTWLLLRSVSSEDTKATTDARRPDAPARQTASVASSSSASPSASPSTNSRPSAPATPAAPPAKAASHPEPSPPPATPPPSASVRSSSWENPAPEHQCRRAWKPTIVPNVEARPCWRRDGERVYMIAEWRATEGTAQVDVHVWLKDGAGEHAVYPTNRTLGSDDQVAHPKGAHVKQWGEWEVPAAELVRGTEYQVTVKVVPKDSAQPDVKDPLDEGPMVAFVY